jgi:PAS domain S-box-containing protein
MNRERFRRAAFSSLGLISALLLTGIISTNASDRASQRIQREPSPIGELRDAEVLVHASAIVGNPDLSCQAETIIDKVVADAQANADTQALVGRCYSAKKRLSRLCILGAMEETDKAEALQLEQELRLIKEQWQRVYAPPAKPGLLDNPVVRHPATLLFLGLLIGAAGGFALARNRLRPLPRAADSTSERLKVSAVGEQKVIDAGLASTVNQTLSMIDEILPMAASSRDLTYFDNVPVGLVSLNDKGEIRSTNTRFAAMTGMLVSELHGRPVVNLLRLGNQSVEEPQSYKTLKDQILSGQTEGWLKQAQSDWIPVDISGADFASGRRKGSLISIMDRSARQQMEELRREFVSMVSHDLAAPLSSLGMFFDLIRHSAAYQSDDYKEAVLSAEEETNRLMKLVTDLLDVSKLESGKFSLDLEEFPADLLVKNAISSVRYLAEKKDLVLDNKCSSLTILVDPERIIQVLINLLSNAIKFSPTKGMITIEGRESPEGFTYSITDQGPGIPEAQRETVFDRFAQVSSSDKKHGAGLGLAICKLIVDQHRGRIWVDTDRQGGARFSVFLPRKDA